MAAAFGCSSFGWEGSLERFTGLATAPRPGRRRQWLIVTAGIPCAHETSGDRLPLRRLGCCPDRATDGCRAGTAPPGRGQPGVRGALRIPVATRPRALRDRRGRERRGPDG